MKESSRPANPIKLSQILSVGLIPRAATTVLKATGAGAGIHDGSVLAEDQRGPVSGAELIATACRWRTGERDLHFIEGKRVIPSVPKIARGSSARRIAGIVKI